MIEPPGKKSSRDVTGRVKRLNLTDRLALIGLITEGARQGLADSPLVADLFSELSNLVDATVSGAKVDRLGGDGPHNGFRILSVSSETGENLGRLNMLYLNKPMPCYYLVYVEVAAAFRNRGLGNMILQVFREFLTAKSAVGILDNIIPPDDPTYDIYLKLDWKPIEEVTGSPATVSEGRYMVYVPPTLGGRDLKDAVTKLVYHIRRKRSAIDMRDNELMVQRTIEEFKDLYAALVAYFERQIQSGASDSLMRFMFTRYVTKLLGFRRRIGQLLGYTGGESLGQIVLHSEIRALPVQSYAPEELADQPAFVHGEKDLWLHLPEALKKHPARIIESLPNYRRPALVAWLEQKGRTSSDMLTIGDLLDLGFDPTRLKELTLRNEDYIFERIQAHLIPEIIRKNEILRRLVPLTQQARIKNARVQTNPALLVIRDRGNAYVLRFKVSGIHWEEAVDQLQGSSSLKALNAAARVDKLVMATIRKGAEWLKSALEADGEEVLVESFTHFVSWNLDTNQPRVVVDFSGTYLESIWIA
jgi:hypothetical protein